jgi:hypothetical protein
MFSRDDQQEKPYDFVPLPDGVPVKEKPAGHDRFKRGLLSGAITGELIALTPVHVASGNIEMTGHDRVPLVKAHFRTNGQIAIPGSSLKGTVRSILEAITYSCVRVQSRITREGLRRGFEPCEVRDERSKLCPACRIFGAMGYQGQVNVADAILASGDFRATFSPSLFQPRAGRIKGRKFYYHGEPAAGNVPLEACTEGSRFNLRIDFVNLSEAELGVLLTAMGQTEPPFALKLGGAKPTCRGSMEVKLTAVETRDDLNAAVDFDSNPSAGNLIHWLNASKSLLVQANLNRLQAILRFTQDRLCPSHGY